MLSEYQLMISDFYSIHIGNVKKLLYNFFDKEKYVLHYENFMVNVKTKKCIILSTRIQSITMAKTISQSQHTKSNRNRKKMMRKIKKRSKINERCCVW